MNQGDDKLAGFGGNGWKQKRTEPSRTRNKPPEIHDLYGTARRFFGSSGSPQIAGIHDQMSKANDPLLKEPAGIASGWKAGKRENEELAKQPPSVDPRDNVAKSGIAKFLRPPAAAAAGEMMKVNYKRDKVQSDPSNYDSNTDAFNQFG